MYKLQCSETPAVDVMWFDKLQHILSANPDVFSVLEPSPAKLTAAYASFTASDYTADPELIPDTVDPELLQSVNHRLAALMHEVSAEPIEFVRTAYIARISEALLENELVLAALGRDGHAFMAANARLYGRPPNELFEACCAWIRQDAMSDTTSGGPAEKYRQALLDVIPDFPSGDGSILFPDDQTFARLKELHFETNGYVAQLFAPDSVPMSAYITADNGAGICQQAIANIGSDFGLGTSNDGIWAVRRSLRQVVHPPGYRIDRDEFCGIVCHEIGSHLLEYTNGTKQPLKLLGAGLDRYEAGNEGRAFMREQIMYSDIRIASRQSSWEYIVMLFVGVAIGSGLQNHMHGFAELYAVLYPLHRYWRERRFPMNSANEPAARTEAWQLTVRIMKGTDGMSPGCGCYMKDLVYLTGNLNCWRLAATDPAIILQGDMGKFDIANDGHWQIIRQMRDWQSKQPQ